MSGAREPQFQLYAALQAEGVDVRAEVRLETRSPYSRRPYFFADLAVYRHGRPVALIECKSRADTLSPRQASKYDGSGLPWRVANRQNLDDVAKWVMDFAARI